MAIDIRQKILNKYNIDVDEKNIFKLYKIKSCDVSEDEMAKILENKKNEWTHVIDTAANEVQIKKAKTNLENADAYEKILSDKKLRSQLFEYYENPQKDFRTTKFAREFFSLTARSGKINREIVEFYFSYFKEERVHKNAILQYLKEQYRLNLSEKDTGENPSENMDGSSKDIYSHKKKRRGMGFIKNSFSKETILKINECVRYYEEASKSEVVKRKYPEVSGTLYEFLGLKFESKLSNLHVDGSITSKACDMQGYKNGSSADSFSSYISRQKDRISNVRYEFGQEFSPLVDMFNTLDEVVRIDEVTDNFEEFLMLIKYDRLTPYMYCLENINKNVIDRFYEIASKRYEFSDINEFLNDYFIPLYNHFNLYISDIKSVVRVPGTRKKQYTSEFYLKGTNNVLFILTYWPLLLFYMLEKFLKIIVGNLKIFSYFLSMLLFGGLLIFGPDRYGLDYKILRYIGKPKLTHIMENMYQNVIDTMKLDNPRTVVMFTVLTILILFMLYIAPVILLQYFMLVSVSKIVKTIDTETIDRTMRAYVVRCQDMVVHYVNNRQRYKIITSIIVNIILVGGLTLCMIC